MLSEDFIVAVRARPSHEGMCYVGRYLKTKIMVSHDDYLKAKETIETYLSQINSEVSHYNNLCYRVDKSIGYKNPSFSFIEKLKEGCKIQMIKMTKNGYSCWTVNNIYTIKSIHKRFWFESEDFYFEIVVTDDKNTEKVLSLETISSNFKILE